MTAATLSQTYLQTMPQAFRPDRAAGLTITYHLLLTGLSGGSWTIAIDNQQCHLTPSAPPQADLILCLSPTHFQALAEGRLDVRRDYERGEIRIDGSLPLALKLVELFPAWAAPGSPPPPPVPTQPPLPTPPPPVTPPAPPSPPTLADYARTMPNGFRPDRAGGLKATVQFDLSGEGGGTWTLTMAKGVCSMSQVRIDSPTVIIQMSGADFIKLANAQLNTTQAYRLGQIRVSGDLNLAARIDELFAAWAGTAGSTPFPTPPPSPIPPSPPSPPPTPTPPTAPNSVYPQLMNGSFDEYQPYLRQGEAKVWKEDQFPERYGTCWTLQSIYEKSGQRFHVMDSGVFGKFTQKYFGGGGRDYHIHGRHSQVITSRYRFDLVLFQTVAAEPGREYTFSGSLVSFFQGTSGPPVHDKIFKTIGLDPTGGQDFSAVTVVWGERDGRDNEWRYPLLKVRARAERLTVFIRLENEERDVGETELNIVHLDHFTLD